MLGLTIESSLSMVSIAISILALVATLFPIASKIFLYHFYQPLSISFHREVTNGRVSWPEDERKTEHAPDNGEWDLFDFRLEKVGRATPYVERVKFGSSIPLEPRGYAEKIDRVVSAPPDPHANHIFQYEWNPNMLTDPITGDDGQEIDPHVSMHLPFRRPDEDFELDLTIKYKVPLRDFGMWWSSGFLYLKPIKIRLQVEIPDEE